VGTRRRKRRKATGVGAKHGTLYLTFTWRGVRCKEYLNLQDSPENRAECERRIVLIKAQIKAVAFDYREWFPCGTKTGTFYGLPETNRPSVTLREYLEMWHARRSPFRSDGSLIANADLHPSTWLHNDAVIRAWLDGRFLAISGVLLNEMTRPLCRDFKRSLENAGLKGKTVLNHMGLLHKALEDAVEDGIIPGNPVPKLASARRHSRHLRKESKPLTAAEAARFLDALPERVEKQNGAHVSGATLQDFYLLWFRTGLRPNEMVALRFEWLFWDQQIVAIKAARDPRRGGLEAEPKTGCREALLDHDPAIWQMFERRRQETAAGGGYVFTDSEGRPLDQEWLAKRVWKPTLKAIGVSARGQYNVKDTFISNALTAGEDPGWVAEVCGTSEEMIFRHYRHWLPSLRRGHGQRVVELMPLRARFRAEIGPKTGPNGVLAVRNPSVIHKLGKWRRGESNPRPEAVHRGLYVRSRVF
jgi:integrase